IRRAHAVHPISALQIEYSLMSRSIEAEILPVVRELGIGVTAYGILSRGLLSPETARLAPGDPRARFPRFHDGNLERNLGLLGALEALAAFDLDLTPAELAAIEAAVPADAVAGDRYDSHSMAALDSERQGPR